MDQRPSTAPVATPAGGPRRASILAAAIVVALALAVVKPWSLGGPGPDGGASAAARRATAEPSRGAGGPSAGPSAPPGDPNAMACLADETEQVVTTERSADREVRSWIAVQGLVATGPLDPRLTPLPIFSSHVVGLGVCAARPVAGSTPAPGAVVANGDSGATLVDVQSVTMVGGVASATDLGPPQLLPGALSDTDPALLYGPPAEAAAHPADGSPSPGLHGLATAGSVGATDSPSPAEAAWRAGSYAIGFRFPFDGITIVRWLRIDLLSGAGGGA